MVDKRLKILFNIMLLMVKVRRIDKIIQVQDLEHLPPNRKKEKTAVILIIQKVLTKVVLSKELIKITRVLLKVHKHRQNRLIKKIQKERILQDLMNKGK
jgi:hypothetical protein